MDYRYDATARVMIVHATYVCNLLEGEMTGEEVCLCQPQASRPASGRSAARHPRPTTTQRADAKVSMDLLSLNKTRCYRIQIGGLVDITCCETTFAKKNMMHSRDLSRT